MIKHIVIYKLKDKDNAKKLEEKFLSMRGKIAELKRIEVGVDVLKSARSFDVVLVAEFDNLEAMEKYKAHPVHLPIVEYVRGIVEVSHSVDYEI